MVWVAIEPMDKMILGIRLSIERSMLVAEQFIKSLIREYGKYNIRASQKLKSERNVSICPMTYLDWIQNN